MADVTFEDYTVKVQGAMEDKIRAVLEECAGELESQAKRNTRVDTGRTKNSWQHRVVASERTVYIGSKDENAVWEEFGTGEYALHGGGRKGGWVYRDDRGNWHRTQGKKPQRAFSRAYQSLKPKLIRQIQNSWKGL